MLLPVPLEFQPGDIAFISSFVGGDGKSKKLRFRPGASLDHRTERSKVGTFQRLRSR
jgi:hypothetical protein